MTNLLIDPQTEKMLLMRDSGESWAAIGRAFDIDAGSAKQRVMRAKKSLAYDSPLTDKFRVIAQEALASGIDRETVAACLWAAAEITADPRHFKNWPSP